MKKIVIKILILLFPFYIVIPLLISQFPFFFLDKEYSIFYQNVEYSSNTLKEDARVLVLGDSSAKSSWYPQALSDDTYNFSLSAITPVEEYYRLSDYLENHKAPKVIIYTQQLIHFIDFEALGSNFWNRSVYLHLLSEEELRDLMHNLKSFEDISNSDIRNYQKELFLYQTYSPVKYSDAFFIALLKAPKRYKENMETYFITNQSGGGDSSWCCRIL